MWILLIFMDIRTWNLLVRSLVKLKFFIFKNIFRFEAQLMEVIGSPSHEATNNVPRIDVQCDASDSSPSMLILRTWLNSFKKKLEKWMLPFWIVSRMLSGLLVLSVKSNTRTGSSRNLTAESGQQESTSFNPGYTPWSPFLVTGLYNHFFQNWAALTWWWW